MIYQSTRNNDEKVNSAKAVVKGIADDGGLFMLSDFSAIKFDYKSQIITFRCQNILENPSPRTLYAL